ncbi:MAG: FtsL-like putative cell division protein [Bacteroidota bacterium]
MDNQYIDKEQLAAEEKKQKAREPKEKKVRAKAKSNILVQILNGEILTRDVVLNNLGYVFFCIMLLILLVAKGYLGKQLTKDIDTSLKRLDASTAEYVEAKARLEERTKRYELVRKLEPRGLKETTKPAKVIRIKKTKD